ncbi:hypothetical protein BB560_001864 [Smittium megazygosporum]|uniref:BZIP domain-containing protein n=1 Tax=Smittium megazygosporum TaxID=133381 RepID=A0A2T9ZGI8_9FUNG|nr:hypothetical protein BB560_001864 [Smittium megazygosporum]
MNQNSQSDFLSLLLGSHLASAKEPSSLEVPFSSLPDSMLNLENVSDLLSHGTGPSPSSSYDNFSCFDIAQNSTLPIDTSPLDTCVATPINHDFISLLGKDNSCTCDDLGVCCIHLPSDFSNSSPFNPHCFSPENLELTSVLALFNERFQTPTNPLKIYPKPSSDSPPSTNSSFVSILPAPPLQALDSTVPPKPIAPSDLPASPVSLDVFRYKTDRQFLDSLPPQLAMKRNRVRSNKHIAEMKKLASSCADDASPKNDPSLAVLSNPISKRDKNTAAARRSRLRKALKLDSLEKQVVELELEKKSLLDTISSFKAEQLKYKEREELLLDHIKSMKMLLVSTFRNNSL